MSGKAYTVGRSMDCDIVLDANWDAVSGKHLEIREAGEHYEVTDCQSLNGTEFHDGRGWQKVQKPVHASATTRLRLGMEHETTVGQLLTRSRPQIPGAGQISPPPLQTLPSPQQTARRPWRDENGRIHFD